MMRAGWVVLLLTFSLATEAQTLARHCVGESVHSVTRGHFKYRFHLNDPEGRTGPTVIFIPGGPGQTGFQTPLAYPDEFRVMRTDPRGAGCNASPDLRDQDLTTLETARDLVAAIRELKLQNYILHGISYGTMVATIAAQLTAEEGLPAPKAVVLEGVLGRAFQNGEYDRAYLKHWEERRESLSPAVLQKLEQPQPFGVANHLVAAWLSMLLNYGEYADGSSLLGDQLASAADDSVAFRIRALTRPAEAERARLHRWVTCREIAGDMRDLQFDFDLKAGHLVRSQRRLCDGLTMSTPFDSARWQSPAPLYYFSGGLDPATPPFQADYHFAHQRGPRTLVRVARGGHAALSGALMDCQKQIWNSLATGQDLEPALAACSMATTLQRFP